MGSSLTHETQPTLLWDQLAATSFPGFDKLYVITIRSSASSTFGAGCGSLKTTCRCDAQPKWVSSGWMVGCALIVKQDPAPHIMLKSCTPIVCAVIVLNASHSKTTHVQHGWKVNSNDVHPTTAPLITASQARAISPSETPRLCSVSEYTRGTVATCVMCHVDVCSLASESSVLKEPSHKLSPFRFPPLQKLKVSLLSLRAALKQKAS